MKITFVTVNLEVSPRTKRLLLRVGLPAAVVLGAGGIAYASLPHTFNSGEVLTAADLNANFQSLDTRLTAVEGHESETNGSRLVAHYTTTTQVGADGAKQVTKHFAGWFDTQRNEYCYPTQASDGQQRCLPSDSGGPTGGAVSSAGAGKTYSDAACTKAVIQVPIDPACSSNPPPPKYFHASSSACSGTQLFPVGAQLSPSILYFGQGASCFPNSVPANTLFYDGSSTTEIPPASFVAFTVTTQTQ